MNSIRVPSKLAITACACQQWIARASSRSLAMVLTQVVKWCCRIVFAVFFAILLSSAVFAQSADVNESPYDEYQLSAEAEIDVANDLMTVNLVATDTGSDPAQLANKINAIMGWAVATLGRFTSIDTQTLYYQTQPQYEKNGSSVKAWVASQAIQLESDNFEEAGEAIQLLQERMQVSGMRLKAKTDTRERAEEQLINTALNAFKRRAKIVQTNMGASGYRVMNLSINTNDMHPYFDEEGYNGNGDAVQRTFEQSGPVPAIEPGTSMVRVNVSGRIKLD